jgi:uncharacterized cupredoxin-like copper-binding protein
MGVLRSRAVPLLVTAISAVLLAAGCGSSNGSGGGAGTPGPTGSAAGTKVTAAEKEYAITLDKNAFTPGVYTFEAQNQGTMPHDLTIAGPGVQQQKTESIQPGQSADLTVTLEKGDYELWCSIPGHKELGMDMHIQVA